MAAAKKSSANQPQKSPPTADIDSHGGRHFCVLRLSIWLFRHSTDLRSDSDFKCGGGAGAGDEEVESPLSVSFADTSPHKWGEVKRTIAALTSPRVRGEVARAKPVTESGFLRPNYLPRIPAASLASFSIPTQSPASSAALGEIHEPPTQTTFGKDK